MANCPVYRSRGKSPDIHHFRLICRDADRLIGVVITVRQNRNASSAEAVTDCPPCRSDIPANLSVGQISTDRQHRIDHDPEEPSADLLVTERVPASQ
jgi:hypothetical protein